VNLDAHTDIIYMRQIDKERARAREREREREKEMMTIIIFFSQ